MTQTAVQPQRTPPPDIADFCRRAVEALRAKVPVREVWLFGSYAEGKAKPDSDVDLFVVLADDHGLKQPFGDCWDAIKDIRPRPPIDVATLDESYWHHPRYRSFGLWSDVVEKGICLFESGSFFSPPIADLPPMPGDPTIPETWYKHAREDLNVAKLVLAEDYVRTGLVHLQQSAEKLLKGWLIERSWHLIKTHQVNDLCNEVERRGIALDWFSYRKVLTDAFFQARSPGPENFLTNTQVEEIVRNVKRLFSELGINL